jgi:hypothetical protein
VRANQQSRIFSHVLSLASRYFSSHLACIALTWLAQSSRPMPKEQALPYLYNYKYSTTYIIIMVMVL